MAINKSLQKKHARTGALHTSHSRPDDYLDMTERDHVVANLCLLLDPNLCS